MTDAPTNGVDYMPIRPDIILRPEQYDVMVSHLNAFDACHIKVRRAGGIDGETIVVWGYGECPHGTTVASPPIEQPGL